MFNLTAPKLVASATDGYMTPYIAFPDALHLPGGTTTPTYGQDIDFGSGRGAPQGHNVGANAAALIPKMQALIGEFASNDSSGMATRLFNRFLRKNASVEYFDDASLNTAAAYHPNIRFFCSAAMSSPSSPNQSIGQIRIHQALKNAKWDINQMTIPTNLGVPAFNEGSKWRGSGDFGNGLGVMINGIQRVYVIATRYSYDSTKQTYDISLKFVFYDVFGLDDDDLNEYGAKKDGIFNTTAGVGITAWWQLQHEHSYPPLVTRIVLYQTLNDVPAI